MSTPSLSKSGRRRMHRVLSSHVESGNLSGLVALVSAGDDVYVETLGTLGFERSGPMQRDSIFRVASITKPVTAVAAMILVEECKIRLDDEVDRWLPELANRRVLRSSESSMEDAVPAKRSVTLRDLLTSCMGIGSVMEPPGTFPIQSFIRDYRIGGDGPKTPTMFPREDEWLRNLGALPLIAQPGEKWMYNVSIDVLGALIARVSGTSLGAFMRERIFEPLGMKDTSFHITPQDTERMPTFYWFDPDTRLMNVFDTAENSAWLTHDAFESGSGGLLSTADDFFAFARTLLNGGRLGKMHILSRPSVELLTSDQVTPQQRAGADIFFGNHSSWAFGMSVDIARNEIYHVPGRFGWVGGFGTCAYVDPVNRSVQILMTQRMLDGPEGAQVLTDFLTTAYEAID